MVHKYENTCGMYSINSEHDIYERNGWLCHVYAEFWTSRWTNDYSTVLASIIRSTQPGRPPCTNPDSDSCNRRKLLFGGRSTVAPLERNEIINVLVVRSRMPLLRTHEDCLGTSIWCYRKKTLKKFNITTIGKDETVVMVVKDIPSKSLTQSRKSMASLTHR